MVTLGNDTTPSEIGRQEHTSHSNTAVYTAVCGGCTARWRSRRLAHCGACHRSFGSVQLFDRHRLGYGEHGRCEDPGYLQSHRMALVAGVWRERRTA